MKRFSVIITVVMLVAAGVLLASSPNTFSLIILMVMFAVVIAGFVLGIYPCIRLTNGFRNGCKNVEESIDIQSSETWITIFKLDSLFHQRDLDQLFRSYRAKVEDEKNFDEIESDLEEYINEDYLSLLTWQTLVQQIPGILTALGILGTFIGLITGISSVGFSSVDAAIESVTSLLSGITTAFYTSISGVVLSVIFNILCRLSWNILIREEGLFLDSFHKMVIPPINESEWLRLGRDLKQIINRLDRLPQNLGYALSNDEGGVADASGREERVVMKQIMQSFANNEFTFYLQPRVSLADRKVVAAEALVRWEHTKLGLLAASSFVPILEKNGYITKLDTYTWEHVFAKIREWMDAGRYLVPISVNVSKIDLYALNVPAYFDSLVKKYGVPPRFVEIEITRNAYIQGQSVVSEAAGELRRRGFKVICDGFDGDYIAAGMFEGIEVDALKLDLRFLPEKDNGSIEPIFEQARRIGVEITAGGIESVEKIAYLRKAGCVEGQGKYFYQPMPIREYEKKVMG